MIRRAVLAASIALVGAGCLQVTDPSLSPSAPSAASQSLSGAWQSVPAGGAAQETCTGFRWVVTQMEDATAAGTFTATCFGNVQVTGTAHGTVAGSTIDWTASALTSTTGATACAVSLIGSGRLGSDELVLPYSGSTCLGGITGTETLKRN
jgi:hypothetical protein